MDGSLSLAQRVGDPTVPTIPLDSASRVLILDDDPTGTQAASAVRIFLAPDRADIRTFFETAEHSAYLLTDARSMDEPEATERLREIVDAIREEAAARGVGCEIILRGDSTLRGHVLAEIDVLDDGRSVIVFAPAYPPAGRVTIDGIHYATVSGRRLPVADTEFGRDPAFAYRESHLAAWFKERGSRRKVELISLATVRAGPEAIRVALRQVALGSIAVPDAVTMSDVRNIAAGLRLARRDGVRLLIRCASSLAAILAGTGPLRVRVTPGTLATRLLVVCGSHTAASTAQLRVLEEHGLSIVELPVGARAPDLDTASERARAALEETGVAVVTTARIRRDSDDPMDVGSRVMANLIRVVARLGPDVDAVIAKGGITSAEVAKGLGARSAEVVGQIEPGVALWLLNLPRPISYTVVPGNVGDPGLLWRLIRRHRSSDGVGRSPAGGQET